MSAGSTVIAYRDDGYQHNTHMGLHVDSRRVLHANGKTKMVDEGEVMGIITGIKPINMEALVSTLAAHIKSLR